MDENKVKTDSAEASPPAGGLSHSYSPGHGYGQAEPADSGRRRLSGSPILALFLAGVILAAAFGSVLTMLLIKRHTQAADAMPTESSAAETEADLSYPATASSEIVPALSAEDLYTLAARQVVSIRTMSEYYESYTGIAVSGFFLSSDGYILTVYHGIESAFTLGDRISVTLPDLTRYAAELIGVEPSLDLAVLKIDAESLNAAVAADSASLSVGQTLYTAGRSAEGLCSLSAGTVVSLDGGIALSGTPGLSDFGGPVYDVSGRAVGILVLPGSSLSPVAIPMTDALSAAGDIISNGYVSAGSYRGLTLATVSAAAAQYYNMVEGAYVYSVDSGSDAERAGLRIGDIITAVGSTETTDAAGFVAALRRYDAAQPITLSVFRNQQTISLTLLPNPND